MATTPNGSRLHAHTKIQKENLLQPKRIYEDVKPRGSLVIKNYDYY